MIWHCLPAQGHSPSWQEPSPHSPSEQRGQVHPIPPAGHSPYVVIILLVSRKSRMPFGEDTSNCSRWDLTGRQKINQISNKPVQENKAHAPGPPGAALCLLPSSLNTLLWWSTAAPSHHQAGHNLLRDRRALQSQKKGPLRHGHEGYYKSEAGNPGLAMVTRLLHTNTASSLEASIVGQADWLLFITRPRVQSLAFLPLQ